MPNAKKKSPMALYTVIAVVVIGLAAVIFSSSSGSMRGSLTQVNAALCSNITIPKSVVSGQIVPVSVSFLNTGSKNWSQSTYHMGPYQGPPQYDDTKWGVARQSLASNNYAAGQIASFSFNAVAPKVIQSTTYHIQFAMLQDNVEWFGNCGVDINIKPPSSDLGVKITPVGQIYKGDAFSFSVDVTNAGPSSTDAKVRIDTPINNPSITVFDRTIKCAVSGYTINCDLTALADNSYNSSFTLSKSFNLTVQTTSLSCPGTFNVKASVSPVGITDPNSSNNNSSNQVTVNCK